MGEFQNFTVIAAQAVIIFGFVKMSFGIFGWLSQEASDNQIRKGIDLSWDYLNGLSADEKINNLILLLLGVINSNLNRIKRIEMGGYFLLIFAINSAILFNVLISLGLVIYSENIFAFLFHAFFLTLLNILCLLIVYLQTLMLPKALNLFIVNLKIMLCLLSIFCIWYFLGTFFHDSLYNNFELAQVINNAAKDQSANAFIFILHKFGFHFIVTILSFLLCLAQAIPLLIFTFILGIGALLNIFPRLLIHSLFLISTDRTPIFNQLGTFFGFLAGGLVSMTNLFAIYA